MKTITQKADTGTETPQLSPSQEHPEIKPDYPLSEKDEVKKAEDKLRKGTQIKKNL